MVELRSITSIIHHNICKEEKQIGSNFELLAVSIKAILFVLPFIIFWIYQLVKCSHDEPPGIKKTGWIIIIALGNWIGALVYLVYKLYSKKISK